MNVEKIRTDIELSSHNAFDRKVLIQSKYAWNDNDARLTIFNKLNRLLASITLGYFLMETIVQKEEFWRQHQPSLTSESINKAFNDYEMIFRIGLLHNLIYCVESSFRIYVRALDPSACKNGQAEFKSIYDWLLKKLSIQATSVERLDLFRNIRNTMHNNGLFVPTSGKDQTIIHKNVSYKFEVGKPNEFVTTELIVNLLPDLIILIENTIESKPLVDIAYIEEIA